MREPFVRSPFGASSLRESWIRRVRENAGQLLATGNFTPSSANGAPIHLLKFDKTSRPARAQTASLIAHSALFVVIAVILTHPPQTGPGFAPGQGPIFGPHTPLPNIFVGLRRAQPSDGSGRGGNENPIPAKRGNLPPISAIQIVRPCIPENRDWHLPEPPTVFDPAAPPVLTPTDNIGLPRMQRDTNSPGPGIRTHHRLARWEHDWRI